MPEQFIIWGNTWQDHHPDWEYRLWTDQNLPTGLPKHYHRTKSWAEKADFIRQWVLAECGGVYLDTDFECLQNIEGLIADKSYFTATENGKLFSIGILGAVPNHPVTRHICDQLSWNWKDTGSPTDSSGPAFITRAMEHRPDLMEQVHVFPAELFYPLPFRSTLPENYHQTYLSQGAYAVHHWAWSWKPRERSWLYRKTTRLFGRLGRSIRKRSPFLQQAS